MACCMHSGCSLAENNLTNYGEDMSAVIKLADAFTKMPNLREVKCVLVPHVQTTLSL
jgi:glycine cleavage system regulatory protein